MTARTCTLLAALALAQGACGDDDDQRYRASVTVMTRNLYLGGNLFPLIQATTPAALVMSIDTLWAAIQASDFQARAKLLADEIAAAAPHLVGLQEVSLYRTQTPSDGAAGAPPNATVVALDFLALLTSELAALGLDYRVVNEVPNGDAELPAGATAPEPFDLRLTDRDVILARHDVETTNPIVKNYARRLTVTVGGAMGAPLVFLRGYGSVDATVGGVGFRFVNSHLEVGVDPMNQEGQAMELIADLDPVPGPIILVGDFNSAANGTSTMSYALLRAKFTDAYAQVRPNDPGFTCCHDDDLKNPTFAGGTRIDLVLFRGPIRASSAEVIGIDPAKKTPGGLWPSDHAGVIATLNLR
jgi:endonuclease/exonuclease/phosphatase family metal-dependent hydrolase